MLQVQYGILLRDQRSLVVSEGDAVLVLLFLGVRQNQVDWVEIKMFHDVFHLLETLQINHVIVRPLSTVEYTSAASVFHSRQWSE